MWFNKKQAQIKVVPESNFLRLIETLNHGLSDANKVIKLYNSCQHNKYTSLTAKISHSGGVYIECIHGDRYDELTITQLLAIVNDQLLQDKVQLVW